MKVEKKWNILPADKAVIHQIQEALNIHPALCRILALRGVTNYQTAKDFFRPSLNHLHDPFLMKGMQEAVSRIQKSITDGEKIMIYGDYDVDGTTSVAVVYLFLKRNFPGADLIYYVPHRYREGYGVSTQGVQTAASLNCKLIITLDCGIKSSEKVKLAKELGIDMIICDHHLPGDDLPNAVAILNPKQNDCFYPYKELSGCGIGFKLISALAQNTNLTVETAYEYLDLVATSIAADIVPIDGENRVLAFFGLKNANNSPCVALQKMKEIAQLKKDFTISDLVFLVAPRINAAGRMDDARKAISFFVEDDDQLSIEKAKELHLDNTHRKEEDQKMTTEALALLEKEDPEHKRKSTMLFQPHWHKGVVGIVASRILEQYYRPTIILTESNGKITGSARSVKGFNIHDALHECASLLENFGGHFFAAGMTLSPENLPAFKEKFEQVVGDTISEESLFPEIQIDAEIYLKDITVSFNKIIQQFEPFGPTNLQPVFISKKVRDKNGACRIVKEDHIRFVVEQENMPGSITGIGFGLSEKFPIIQSGEPFDLVYHIAENEWQGNKSLQIKVLDIKLSDAT